MATRRKIFLEKHSRYFKLELMQHLVVFFRKLHESPARLFSRPGLPSWALRPPGWLILLTGAAVVILGGAGCAGDRRHKLYVSVPDQRLLVLRDGQPAAYYPISTSKFGLGSRPGSYATPVGEFRIREKIGHGLPKGAVLKSRQPTGEILPVNAPGRDPIVTRILWLDGQEPHNRNAYERFIYIHGTPEERTIGTPSSYGCIRMRSRDVIELFDMVGVGARVRVIEAPLLALPGARQWSFLQPPSTAAPALAVPLSPEAPAWETAGQSPQQP